jgi:hypothetical protein
MSSKQSKQPVTVYTVLLIASAVLMFFSCILMGIEAFQYGSPWQ